MTKLIDFVLATVWAPATMPAWRHELPLCMLVIVNAFLLEYIGIIGEHEVFGASLVGIVATFFLTDISRWRFGCTAPKGSRFYEGK